jgi:hypothetical protein
MGQALTVSITAKMKLSDAAAIRAEAERRGYSETGKFAREVLLENCRAPKNEQSEGTLLLETMLRFEFALIEMLKQSVEETGLTVEGVEAIRDRAEAISGALLEKFLSRRSRVMQATS